MDIDYYSRALAFFFFFFLRKESKLSDKLQATLSVSVVKTSLHRIIYSSIWVVVLKSDSQSFQDSPDFKHHTLYYHQLNRHVNSTANSGRWWRMAQPSVLQSLGLQRVGSDLATE